MYCEMEGEMKLIIQKRLTLQKRCASQRFKDKYKTVTLMAFNDEYYIVELVQMVIYGAHTVVWSCV